jgi:hypothetical protein
MVDRELVKVRRYAFLVVDDKASLKASLSTSYYVPRWVVYTPKREYQGSAAVHAVTGHGAVWISD